MILFFRTPSQSVIAVESSQALQPHDNEKLCWLFGEATPENEENLKGYFVGPRREMITPWSTNAVEIAQNMGFSTVARIEEYFPVENESAEFDPMLQRMYHGLDQQVFTTNRQPTPIQHVEDLEAYNEQEGLALSKEEMDYLKMVEKDLGRKLTDSEVFGFAQINSEHCRHKIFGGTFVIDGVEQESSLFQMIKKTTQENPNKIISAYKDNVAFAAGPVIEQFAPADHSKPDFFQVKEIKSVISLKAETHNFPTTVAPFNGASTGTGGEIRDRMGGGKGSWPNAGTAVQYQAFENQTAPLQQQMNEIRMAFRNPAMTEKESEDLMTKYEELNEQMKAIVKNAIEVNIHNIVGVDIFKSFVYDLTLTEKENILSQIPSNFDTDPGIERISQQVKSEKATSPGNKFTNLTMDDPEGKEVSLSDYCGKGKLVLIDFWASWCGPCRKEMPELVELYKKYKNKNFEIVGVSFDNSADAWKNAIKQMDMTWPQMSDLKGWQSEGASIYGISSIPSTILVGGDGVILERNLRGDELYEKIKELLD